MREEKEKNRIITERTKKIGVFDSGIGGATVLTELVKVLPNEDYIYYSDSKNNPYGDKTQKEIIEICDNIVQFFIQKNCKAIVIACNTASAEAVTYLRKKYKTIPFIAIEPAYKMVYDYAYDEATLVMATKGTIESEKFNLLYKKYNNGFYVNAQRDLTKIKEAAKYIGRYLSRPAIAEYRISGYDGKSVTFWYEK